MNTSLKSRHSPDHHSRRAESLRFRVVRFDGVPMGGAPSLVRAQRMASVISQGQRRDFASVVTREAKS